jgi:ABC-type bacteriocin/lantibiotic exporter with double-glycine peptidase domain
LLYLIIEAQKLEKAKGHGGNSPQKQSPTDDINMTESPSDVTAKEDDVRVHISKDVKKTSSMSSLKRRKLEEEKEEALKELLKTKVDTYRILKMNQPEWIYFFLGGLGAIGNGIVMPLFALIFSEVMVALGSDKANFWALMFLILAIASFLTNFAQAFFFQYSAQKLTRRLRAISFRTILRQEIGYFDEESNTTGVLTTRLAEDANLVPGLTGPTFGGFIQAGGGLVAGLIIAFINCWQLSLVVLGTVPLMGFAGYLQLRSLQGYGQASKKDYENAGQICCEAVENIRTVATLTLEDRLLSMYDKRTILPHKTAMKGAFVSSFGYGLSMGMPFFIWAGEIFWK